MTQRLFQVLGLAFFGVLLFFGSYTLLYYLGVPYHTAVLLDTAQENAVKAACDSEALLCRGWNALFPFLFHTVSRAAPFAWYAIVSVLVFVFFLGWRKLKTGAWEITVRCTPLKLTLLFVLLLWLLTTVFSFGQFGSHPFRRVFEPLPQVYPNAPPEALDTLQENFDALRERGCLRFIGKTTHGAEVHDLRLSCVQTAFFSRILPQVGVVLLLLFELLVLGRALLYFARVRAESVLREAMWSLGCGIAGWSALLWLIAVLGVYTQAIGWLLMVGVPLLCARHSYHVLRQFLKAQWPVSVRWSSGFLILGWLLFSYLVLNFLNVVRPFPIGWDDLGRYVNNPRLLVSYGRLIPQMAGFRWEYFTSLGFLLFGYDSFFGATAALVINWTAGLLAVVVTYVFARTYFGEGRGLLAALLYYTLPLVGHFSYADMKIDNAVYVMSALAVFAVFVALFSPGEEQSDDHRSPLPLFVLAGVFGGLAFSFKPTAIMALMSLGPVIVGAMLHWTGFVGGVFFALAVYVLQGTFSLGPIWEKVYAAPSLLSQSSLLFLLVAVAAVWTGYAVFRRQDRLKSCGMALGLMAGAFLISIALWALYNSWYRGDFGLHLSIPDTEFVRRPQLSDFPQELAADPAHPQCRATARAEELDRYWGLGEGKGWGHYLTLPWRTVMNLNSSGYYVTTMPALLLLPLLLLSPLFWRRDKRWFRFLFWATAFMLLQWMFLANGVPWYGLVFFIGAAVLLEGLFVYAPSREAKVTVGVFLGCSLLITFAMRFWQFEQQLNLFEYPLGKVSAEALRERTIPHYDDIREIATERARTMPDRPYIFRVGTFIPYFLPRNIELIPIADNQLTFFNCIHQERDSAKTLKRLQALGFNNIIFDTNTATIEQDLKGTLHQKVQAFVDFLNTPGLGLMTVINDPDRGVAFVLLP